MDAVQEMIHRLEVGGGVRYLRFGLAVLAVLLLVAAYDLFCYRNFSAQEAMDSAQLGRNLAQGKGYTTQFIRPLSLYLFLRRFQEIHGVQALGSNPDASQIRTNHPDIANAPVYPLVLAGLMKVLPFQYDIPAKPKPFWSVYGRFARYQPDFLIALFNQLLFLAGVLVVFLLAKRLFDRTVAWWSALLLLGTELLWRFSVSGLSTMLLLLIFAGLLWCLVGLDHEVNEPRWGSGALFVYAALAGLLTGIGCLTRYAFGWLLLPVLLFLLLFAGRQRVLLAATSVLAFSLVLAPWVLRNVNVCGKPFGTAGYAIIENTAVFPEHSLERSLEPDLKSPPLSAYPYKLINNLRIIVTQDLPRLGGTWVSAFFLVGLLVGMRNPEAARLRYFVLACLVVLVLVQAMGRTQLSVDSPDINSENLLVLLAPAVLIYGVSLLNLLMDQVDLPLRELRYALMGGTAVLLCLPLLLGFLPPHQSPLVYPPYAPPWIQENAVKYTTKDELLMSDIPWATAWYGQRQCVWVTANGLQDFYAINDLQKSIQEIFFSPLTLDTMSSAHLLKRSTSSTWDGFLLDIIARNQMDLGGAPKGFPLRYLQPGWPYQFVLTYRQHEFSAPSE